MDQEACFTLMEVFQGLPDPRKARGKRYDWLFLLALIGAALASGQQTAYAIAHWMSLHRPGLCAHLRPPRSSMPSESTIRRVLRSIDIAILEQRLSNLAQYLATTGPEQGTITTMDALLTQRPFAQQILDQNGHYLMVVKRNQGTLYDAIALLFDEPPWLPREKEADCQVHRCVEKGHGRLEKRTLESSPTFSDYLDWPSVGQVMRRRYECIRLKTGGVSTATTC
jgi:hypothetical protein